MTSRKPSAKAKQRANFESDWDSFLGADSARVASSGVFAREQTRIAQTRHERENQHINNSCASKDRHGTKREAEESIARLNARGVNGLTCYKCEYCGGWHLTSHPWE